MPTDATSRSAPWAARFAQGRARVAAWLTGHPVLAVVAAGAALRLVLAAAVPITTDEAYYVDWARHLRPGYLDHPPAVAWCMAFGLWLLGDTPLGARLPAVLLQAGATWLAADLVASMAAAGAGVTAGPVDRARAGGRAGATAALLLQAAPVFSLGAVLMTPDAPLGLAWIGTLWAVERALTRSPRWCLAAGLFLGLGLLSKLTAGLLGLAVLGGLLASGAGRALLSTPWPWQGALLSAAVAAPMLAWNAANGWPSLAFQAEHGLRGGGFSLPRLLGSVGAQAAYVSPVLLVLAAGAGWRGLRARAAEAGGGAILRVVAATALPVVLFFTAAAAFTPGALPHWPGPGWLSAILLLALAGHRWLARAAWTGAALTALLLLALALPLPRSPLDELRGWREGAVAARAAAGGARLAATHWMAMGHLGWALGEPVAYVGARRSGPSLYAPDPLAGAEPLLLVEVEGLGEGRAALEARLGPLEPRGEAVARLGDRVLRRYRFWLRPGRP